MIITAVGMTVQSDQTTLFSLGVTSPSIAYSITADVILLNCTAGRQPTAQNGDS
jgi:hypothetical protein